MRRVANEGEFLYFEMTEDEFRELTEEFQGLCIKCGETRDTCEPDAELYPCEACEAPRSVYGAEWLLMLGRIRLTGPEGKDPWEPIA